MDAPALLYLGALAISSAVAMIVWAFAGSRGGSRTLIATNLERGTVTSLREIQLARPTTERTLAPLLSRLASVTRRLTPAASVDRLERKLVLTGRPTNWPLERVLSTKIVLAVMGAILTTLQVLTTGTQSTTVILLLFTLLLYATPDVILSARVSERQRSILLSLPDTLDQMTICMEAGLTFEAAMARASHSNLDPLAQELLHTLQDMQVGVGRRDALTALAERSTVQDLRYFVTAVLQAERYGVPIGRVLNDQAAELRMKRRQRAEEEARKLPVKLLIPLILLILPPLFIVVIGPAALELMDAMDDLAL